MIEVVIPAKRSGYQSSAVGEKTPLDRSRSLGRLPGWIPTCTCTQIMPSILLASLGSHLTNYKEIKSYRKEGRCGGACVKRVLLNDRGGVTYFGSDSDLTRMIE